MSCACVLKSNEMDLAMIFCKIMGKPMAVKEPEQMKGR
jgi:hypothetical protein